MNAAIAAIVNVRCVMPGKLKKVMRPKSQRKPKLKKLTDRQKATLKRHSEHHTTKHMNMMKKMMREGMSFGKAHKIVQKKVGK